MFIVTNNFFFDRNAYLHEKESIHRNILMLLNYDSLKASGYNKLLSCDADEKFICLTKIKLTRNNEHQQ